MLKKGPGMAHSHHENERQYHRRGCIICEIIHRLYILEEEFDTMSQAWDEQRERLASYVNELRGRFDSLSSQIQELTEQVQNAPNIDSAVAEEAARNAEAFKNQLDQLDQAFDLQEPGETPPVDPGTGGEPDNSIPTEPGTPDNSLPEVDPTPPVDSGTESPGGGVDSGTGEPPAPDNTLPGDLGGGSGEVAPEPGSPEPPVTDPNDPNAGEPSAPPESPDSDPTIPVPGSEQ
jgi:hypothetical protein